MKMGNLGRLEQVLPDYFQRKPIAGFGVENGRNPNEPAALGSARFNAKHARITDDTPAPNEPNFPFCSVRSPERLASTAV